MSEARLEKQVVDFCGEHDLECCKLRIDGENGFPDRTILGTAGRIAFLELKNPNGKGKLSPRQQWWEGELYSRAFDHLVSNDFEEIRQWIIDVFDIE